LRQKAAVFAGKSIKIKDDSAHNESFIRYERDLSTNIPPNMKLIAGKGYQKSDGYKPLIA
jgi:hypothetical protein